MAEDDLPGGSFDACVAQMTDDGHSEDAADRICGSLLDESKADNGDMDELLASIQRGRGLIADVGVELNSAVDVPAIDSQWVAIKDAGSEYNIRRNTEVVLKQDADDEKRISYAPAMIPRELDKEGDVVSTATVEQAAHEYLASEGGVDTDHNLIDGKGEVVESWIEPDARSWDLPSGETKEYPAGTWMLGIKWDSEPWSRIKSGELTGLSIYGQAEKVDLGKSVDKEFVVPFAAEGVVHLVYESESLAERASEQMGLGGDIHAHELDGSTVYMPGESHDDFVDAYMELATGDDGDTETDETAESAAKSGDNAESDGETDNTDAEKATKQNNTMTDDNTGDGGDSPSVDTLKSEIESLTETVSTLKEAVEADKQPDANASGAMDEAVQALQSHSDIELSASEIRDQIKELIAQSGKADHGDDEDDEDEEKADGEGSEPAETAEKRADDANLSKAGGAAQSGASTTAEAKDAGGHDGIPSYGDAASEYEGGN